ncbi:uncharacterized protein LOC117301407 isoform X2 [Asterias rubens]|uniref:uncharacterized protein LOC117301407 isoform X2 n=1 Tax=Asterias rubens TaxID=7604 RepID=UPI0014559837|nr:uncharacterized protein LOC117301407 isoform X2 [Asterias rubens]
MHDELNELAFYKERIIHSQERFLDKAEMWIKRQEKEMQDDSNVVRYSLQGDPTDLKQSKQDDQTDESDLEGLKISMEKTLLSDKDEARKKRQEYQTEDNPIRPRRPIYGSSKSSSSPRSFSVEQREVEPLSAREVQEKEKDATDEPIDEDSNVDAAGFTSITQTTQAVTQMAPRNETPSHLEDVLNKFNKQTLDISANEKTDILLQLPYMAVGFFNEKGGILALEKYDVHLYIPHGAIAEGPPQLVYIYVNPDEVVADTANSEEEQLSPAVQCGPPGLRFKHSVVLSFPHHAESSDWEFTAKMSSASSESWQALDSSTDGQLVSAQGDKAIFLVKHFSLFTLFGRSLGNSRKRVRVGAFGDIFDPKSYAFRVYVWKADRVSEQRVLEFEKERTSEILDAFRDLQFRKDKGHMSVEMTKTDEGWEVRPQKKQEIHEEDVWAFSQNSVSFNVSSRSSNTDDIPYMAVDCYQQQEGDDGQGRKLLLSVGPKPKQKGNNNLIQTRDAQRPPEARNLIPVEFHTSGSGENTLHLSSTEVDGAIQSAVTDIGQRPELFGEIISAQTANEPEPILPFPDNLTLTNIETEVLFREIAEKLGEDWGRLATHLGHDSSDLYAIKHDNAGDVRDQIFCMLVRWRQGLGPFGKNAFDTLSSGLEIIKRNDLVEFLKRKATRYRRQPKSSSS